MTSDPDDDPFLWLEAVDDPQALDWVRARNAETRAVIEAEPGFEALRARIQAVLDSRDKIPAIRRRGAWLWNFWQDEAHPRGLWRCTALAEYRRAEPAWDVVLDLDELARAEGENWVWGGATVHGPAYRRCMLALSRGGADAQVLREFDIEARRFVRPEEGGFVLPEAKSSVDWLDADTLVVGTDFGPGSMTDSGYPRTIRRWRRGTPLASAETLFEARADDMSAWASVDDTPGHERVLLGRWPGFYTTEAHLVVRDGVAITPAALADPHTPAPIALRRLPQPEDASLSFWYDQVLLELRSDWTCAGRTWPAGSLLAGDAAAFEAGRPDDAGWQALFTPSATRSLAGHDSTRSTVLLDILDDVASRVEEWRRDADGRWTRRVVEAPFPGTLAVDSLQDPLVADDPLAEAYTVSYTDFITPDSLLLARTGSDERVPLKARPAFFDAEGMRVEQRFARSADGTRVPYFVVWPRGTTSDGDNPTLLYGYGGFEVSQQPWYSGSLGAAWYARGGVLAVANIRGGGEYGPAWHQAALKRQRQRSFDDFIAVAEDLVATGVTRPPRLGIEGGSNGGLLVGAVMLQRPELLGAVVCQVPLLDMRRYHRLLAGASWMDEYGDPDDPEDWAAIARYSPYQNVRADMRLPPVLFTTSTRDDRVHPGHARKMAARMLAQGHRVAYYENIEGGHGGAADNRQRADLLALEYTFLWGELARR